ncbi:MAG: proline dehydrogenase [Gemmatimonadetes bacterium]|nr:proline dehydrogenase [Gemmatimonadota bacterium]
MLRNALLWASKNPFLAHRLPTYGFVRRATRRFMPGETLEDALREAARLQGAGSPTTFTLLGENVTTPADADTVAEHYLGVLEAVRARGLDTEVSVKPTQLGLDLGATEARKRLERIVRACDPGSLVWVDMESTAYVDATLEIFRGVREDHENVGLCLQSYLYRTEKDLEALLPLRPAIRLVKGAYKEPADLAFPRKADVDRNFVKLAGMMLRARVEGQAGRPVMGTHDPRMIAEAGRLAHELGLRKDAWEVAMLYGIKTDEQERLVRTGHGVRVLVAYGSHWFPWYMRRLAERPANVWFVVKQLFG